MDLRLFPYTPERDAYRLLQVDPAAHPSEIMAACRRLAQAFHPDRNRSPRATEEMQVVNAVRRLLTDPTARAEYDGARGRWWRAAVEPRRPLASPWRVVAPLSVRSRPSTLELYARAGWAGLLAALAALVPARCERCRTIIGPHDTFCAACGGRLLGSRA